METLNNVCKISDEDFKDICRLCTKTNRKLSNIFVSYVGFDCALSEAVMECAPINVSPNDGLPTHICNQCITKLCSAYRFRMLCMESDMILREYNSTIINKTSKSEDDASTKKRHNLEIINVCENRDRERSVDLVKKEDLSENFYISVEYDDCDPQMSQLQSLSKPVGTKNEPYFSNDNATDVKLDETVKSECSFDDCRNNKEFKPRRTTRNKQKQTARSLGLERVDKKSRITYKNRKKDILDEYDGPPCCEMCKMTFVSRTNLLRHLSTHTGEKRFSCSVCHKKFATQAYVKSHMVIHSKERKYSCDICGKTFMFNSDLTIHMRKHTGERPYVCETCAKGFVSSSALNAHRFKHGPKRFFCVVCNKGFTYKLELDSHILIHRKDKFIIYDGGNLPEMEVSSTVELVDPNQSLVDDMLPITDSTTKANPSGNPLNTPSTYVKPEKPAIQISRSDYEVYLNLIEKLRKGPKSQDFICDVCHKVLSSGSNLYRHKLIHTGLKPHICEMCGKGFKLKADLADHKNRHLGIRTIQCEYCPKMFASRSDYGKHVSTHMDHKPFSCDICGKSYYNVYALNHHKKEHMHPFKCSHDGCLKTYPTEDKLMRHLKIHDDSKRRYRCEQCDKVLSTVKSLSRHIRKVHNKDEPPQIPAAFPIVQRSE